MSLVCVLSLHAHHEFSFQDDIMQHMDDIFLLWSTLVRILVMDEYRLGCHPDDAYVQPDAPVLHIPDVTFHAAFHLPKLLRLAPEARHLRNHLLSDVYTPKPPLLADAHIVTVLHILPYPVMRRHFAIRRILLRDILPRIISGHTRHLVLQSRHCTSHMYRHQRLPLRHPKGFMRHHEYLYPTTQRISKRKISV